MMCSPLNEMLISEGEDSAVTFERCGMKKGEERDERTFPEREHSGDDRIHMEVSVPLSASAEADEPVECTPSVVEMLRYPSVQRTLREKDG